jgi:hypothetical protein
MTPEWKMKGTLEDILADINENYSKEDAEYFVNGWKMMIEHALNYTEE